MPTARYCARCSAPVAEPLLPGYHCPHCGSDRFIDTPDRAADDTFFTRPPAPAAPASADEFAATRSYSPGDQTTAPFAPSRNGSAPAVPGYEVGPLLGRGGMGCVYEAVQTGARRRVAVKVIYGWGDIDRKQRERFHREAVTLGQLTHPNVVRLYEVGDGPDGPFYSMELMPGGTLADRVKRNGEAEPLPPRDAAGLVAAAADGVAAAHAIKVLHRDLKPSNILLDAAADGSVTPKVADFGLAKFEDGRSLTEEAALVGTLQYMSPEQYRGQAVDARSDVFGLGGTLYYLLTGRPPYPTPALGAARPAPPPPRSLNPGVDADLDAVVRKALAEDRRDRYPSSAALAADLRKWLAGEPLGPITWWWRARRWLRRHQTAVALGLLALVTVAAVAVAVRESRPERQITRALARGETVTLIGETGGPAYKRWAQGEVVLTNALTEDGTCGFQTHSESQLELCQDPQHDRFVLKGQLRHLVPGSVRAAVGVYVGWVQGDRVRRWSCFEFNDFWTETERVEARFRDAHAIKGFDALETFREDRPRTSHAEIGQYPFPPANLNPNPWRRFEVVVAPERVTFWWETAPKILSPILTATAQDFRNRGKRHQVALDQVFPAPTPRTPEWTPRGGVGVYARETAVGFRNLTLEPTPSH